MTPAEWVELYGCRGFQHRFDLITSTEFEACLTHGWLKEPDRPYCNYYRTQEEIDDAVAILYSLAQTHHRPPTTD